MDEGNICELPPDGAFWPVTGLLLVLAMVSFLILVAMGKVRWKDGRGLAASLSSQDRTVRLLGRLVVVGVAATFGLTWVVGASEGLYDTATQQFGSCAAGPAMWTPAVVFTAVGLFTLLVQLVLPFQGGWWALGRLSAIAAGFWLSTLTGNVFWLVWLSVVIALFPDFLRRMTNLFCPGTGSMPDGHEQPGPPDLEDPAGTGLAPEES